MDRDRQIIDAWAAGHSGGELAQRWGISRQRVSQIIRAANLPARPVRSKVNERFWRLVDRSGDGCWLWTGDKYQNTGYGRAYVPTRRHVGAHRRSWELTYGVIPKDMWVLHTCDNPPCVRPDHLFLGTAADNVHDSQTKGRRRVAAQAASKWSGSGSCGPLAYSRQRTHSR